MHARATEEVRRQRVRVEKARQTLAALDASLQRAQRVAVAQLGADAGAGGAKGGEGGGGVAAPVSLVP
jgi:hypothetical protein